MAFPAGSIASGSLDIIQTIFNTNNLEPGSYDCTLIISTNDPNTEISNVNLELLVLEPSLQNVYPGDTDNNGFVNENDILPIGIYFLSEGFSREEVISDSSWEGYSVSTWDQEAATFADANGDGVIDEKDVIWIGVNWGKTHDSSLRSYEIDLDNEDLLNEHLDNISYLLESLSGEGEAYIAIRDLLREILGLPPIPSHFSLYQNYPNPFNPVTSIVFDLPKSSNVDFLIYDIMGRVIEAGFRNKFYEAGSHNISFNGEYLSSGVYFYQLTTDDFMEIKKMVLIK